MSFSQEMDFFGIPTKEIKKDKVDVAIEMAKIITESERSSFDSIKAEAERRLQEMNSKISTSGLLTEEEDKEYNVLTDEMLEVFIDGLLTKLAELEMSGKIPEIESAEQAQKALLSVIRSLFVKRGIVNKMTRQFTRFGSKRFLRNQKGALNKALG